MEQSTKRYLKNLRDASSRCSCCRPQWPSALSHLMRGGPSSAQGVTVSDDGQQVKDSSLSYALDSFTRANKGTSKLYSGKYYGYRYPLVSRTSCAVAVTDTEVPVFIPQTVADELGIDLNDAATRSALESLIKAGDTASASGGQAIDRLDVPFTFIEGTTAERSGMVFETGFEVEEDVYYLTVYPAGMKLPAAAAPEDGSDPSRAALYAESFKLLPADQVTVSSAPTGWDAVADFFSTLDWRPLWVSLRSTALAMVVIFVLGLLAAWARCVPPPAGRACSTPCSRFRCAASHGLRLPLLGCSFGSPLMWAAVDRARHRPGIYDGRPWRSPCIVGGLPLMYARPAAPSRASMRPCSMRRARWVGPRDASSAS